MQNNNYSRSLKGIFLVKDLGLITCPEELECLPSLISWTPLSANLVPNTCSGSPWQGTDDERELKRCSPSPFPGPQALQDAFLCSLCSLYQSFLSHPLALEQPTHCVKLSTVSPFSSVSAPASLLVVFIV